MRIRVTALACAIGATMSSHLMNGATEREPVMESEGRSPSGECCPVIELRQYTLKPGQRDALIDVFDRHFVESQEALGMTIVGQFRDTRRADRFVWIRGFSDMTSRHRALERFYGGPVWAAHKAAANETMLDVSDVLLLRPVRPDRSFQVDGDPATAATGARRQTTVLVGIYELAVPPAEPLVSRFEREVAPRLRAQDIDVKGLFVTETAPNTFTRLPVREGQHVLVWVGTVERREASPGQLDGLAMLSALGDDVPTVLDLEPTSRSLLGGGGHAARAGKHDFDFLHGSWRIHNRYLKRRLQQSSEWFEFDAQSDVQPLLNGLGQLDRYSAVRDGAAVEGMTLRLFNPETGDWSLHWADTVRPGVLLPPMVGGFRGDLGEFFGDEMVDGKKVLCRFHWSRANAAAPRWEQAFSNDGGKTWETNWIMTFTRR